MTRGEKRRCAGKPGRGSGWLFDQAWIEADLRDAGRLRWDTTPSPWLLDRAQDGTWYLVGSTSSHSSVAEYELSRPNGVHKRFVPFRLAGNQWVRIKAEEFPGEFIGPNLLVYSEAAFSERKDDIYFDGTIHRGVPPGSPLRNGELLDLKRKDAINFPPHRDQQYKFRPTREWFDDGVRYYRCSARECTLEKVPGNMEGRAGRLPTQSAPRSRGPSLARQRRRRNRRQVGNGSK